MSEEQRPAWLSPGVPIIKLDECDCRTIVHPDGRQSVEIHMPLIEMAPEIRDRIEQRLKKTQQQ
jgi:hypothetical protein